MLSSNHTQIHKILKYITLLIFILFILFWTGIIVYQQHLQNVVEQKYKISPATSIDTLMKVNLGGIDQWCLIRGWDRSNPALLYLHGGPGGPLFPRARAIGTLTNLEKHFVMVYWEQRGTGKSYHSDIPVHTMTMAQFAIDIQELTRFLIRQFNVRKIYLLGTSWGSMIGLLSAHENPELYHAFAGVGQLVNPLESDRMSYKFCLETAEKLENKTALQELRQIGPPPYDHQELITQRKWLARFEKIVLVEKGIQDYPQFNTIEELLSTPEYTMIDILEMGLNPYFSLKHLWNDKLYQTNLIQQVPEINIPVYFLMGRHDYITPAEVAENYYEQLSAPKGKNFIWFENSGHEPYFQEPDKFGDVMVNVVLKDISERVNKRIRGK